MKYVFLGLLLSALSALNANAQSLSGSSRPGIVSKVTSVAAQGATTKAPYTNICNWQAVPAGWVIDSFRYNPACGGYYNNSMDIRLPVNPDTVCIQSVIPNGFVAVGRTYWKECNLLGPSAVMIRMPSSWEQICTFSPIPPGFVIIRNFTGWECGSGIHNNMYTIKIPGPRETICDYSPVPYNYVVTGQTTSFDCGNNRYFNARIIVRI
jgi:hypothetical protein